jgi:hypothetical protein
MLRGLKTVWLKTPALGALVLGLGGLFGGTAQADRLQIQPARATPEASGGLTSPMNDVSIRIDGGNIFISQNGGVFEELRLGNTPEAAHLRKLLRDAGADGQSVSIPVDAMIVASGGGSGKGQKPKEKTSTEGTDPAKAK